MQVKLVYWKKKTKTKQTFKLAVKKKKERTTKQTQTKQLTTSCFLTFPFLEVVLQGIVLPHAALPADGILNAHAHCCAVNDHILKSMNQV